MEVLGGDEAGLVEAMQLVLENPSPRHIEEDLIVTGASRGIEAMLDESLAASAVACYAIRGEDAIVGGVTLMPARKPLTHQLWMLTTAGAAGYPRWLIREGRRMLAETDAFFKFPFGYVQAIPANYPEGLNYARHMGFAETDRMVAHGDEVIVFERMIPQWAQ